MASISVQNLRKLHGSHVAVEDLSLDVPDGHFMVLLGPSGCGKTTTLNCIAGLETVTDGRILFDDNDVTGFPPHQRNIAMVFQSALLYPHLTARQNITMSLKRSGLAREEQGKRVVESATILGIEGLLDKMPSQMSGGERQRVATAKAIVRQPGAFLMDEPLSALDAALRLTLRSEIVNLQKTLATTMIYVTHDQTEAMTMGDQIAVMKDGLLEQVGTPDDIYHRPETLFVAGFVGTPPMNFLEGELTQNDGVLALVCEGRALSLPWTAASVNASNDGRFCLGIRPQHLTLSQEDSAEAIPATVFALERLGKESIVILETPQHEKIRVIVDPQFSTSVGERLFFRPDARHGFLFNLGTGRKEAAASGNR